MIHYWRCHYVVTGVLLGLCLGWKGLCIRCVTRGREGREGRGGEGRGRGGEESGGEGRGGEGSLRPIYFRKHELFRVNVRH